MKGGYDFTAWKYHSESIDPLKFCSEKCNVRRSPFITKEKKKQKFD